MKVKILDPFKDAQALWLGLDHPEKKMIRKVFRLITPETVGAKHITAGLTIFEPGESSSMHNHPGSEELDVIIKGSGIAISDGEEMPFKQHDYIFIPEGVMHQHVNNGNEPLWLLWSYSPKGYLPKT